MITAEEAQILSAVIPAIMFLLYSEYRFKTIGNMVDSLRTWAPRLVGSVKHGSTQEVAQQAGNENALLSLLVTLGQNQEAISGIMSLLNSPVAQQFLGSGGAESEKDVTVF